MRMDSEFIHSTIDDAFFSKISLLGDYFAKIGQRIVFLA